MVARLCRNVFIILLVSGCLLVSVQAHSADTRALIVAGLGGEDDYELQFQRHATAAADRLREVTDDVTLLLGEAADREAVQAALGEMVQRVRAEDTLVFMFVGHGSYDGERFRFNVPGADFTAQELALWLESARASHQLIVVTGSSSGAVLEPLEREGRTLITATRSGEERNATVFGGFFSAALEDDAADIDKDGTITAREAFHYAADRVDQFYAGQNEMATEHPQSAGPEPVMVLARLTTALRFDPALAHLYDRREALELDIAALSTDKANYSPDDYFAELQRLLLDLAAVENQLTSPVPADSAGQEATP